MKLLRALKAPIIVGSLLLVVLGARLVLGLINNGSLNLQEKAWLGAPILLLVFTFSLITYIVWKVELP